MTEEEAKTKWCKDLALINELRIISMVMMQKEEPAAVAAKLQTMTDGSRTRCIASDCAMWVVDTSTKPGTAVSTVCGGHCGLINV